MRPKQLTPKKLAILNFMKDRIQVQGVCPTLAEIAYNFKVSTITVFEHLRRLEELNYITRPNSNTARGWIVVDDKDRESIQLAESKRLYRALKRVLLAAKDTDPIKTRTALTSAQKEINSYEEVHGMDQEWRNNVS